MATREKNKTIKSEKDALDFVKDFQNDLQDVPTKFMTKKVCDLAFKVQPYSRTYVWIPQQHRTFAQCLAACSEYGAETKDFAEGQLQEEWGISVSAFVQLKKKGKLPHFKKNTPQEVIDVCYKKAFAENPGVITSMPKHLIPKILKNPLNVKSIINHSVKAGSFSYSYNWAGHKLIQYIPEKFMTKAAVEALQEQLKEAAEKGSSGYFFNVDEKYITNDLYLTMLEKSPTSLENIPEERITQEMCDVAVKKDGRAIKAVPEQWQSKYYIDVVKSGKGLYEIPEEDRTDRLCALAVEQEADQYEYVPQDKKSYALSLAAIDKNAEMIEFVPSELVDDEMMIRLIISIFRKTWEHDFALCQVLDYRKKLGQTEPVLTTVYTNFFGSMDWYDRDDKIQELMHEVIKREPKLYFEMINFSGENDDNEGFNRFNAGNWKKYFERVPTFEHAVTAARADIEVITGFKQNIQARVWKEFLENNK
jgi:hypothetical protein